MSKLIRSIAAFSIVLSMPVAAFAQGGQELAGSWTYVSAVTERDGTKSDIFGPAAKGALVFDTHGRYTITFISSGLPKFAANNRAAGTAYVDGPRLARAVQLRRSGRLRSYVRPLLCGRLTAGPDGLRGSGSKQSSDV